MPQISVIVPVYKVEKYLHECVDSILAQTYRDFELILVDDGSPDNCGAICDEYAAKDSRIRVIHQENQGVSVARNAALDVAKGKFIAFVDSDDVLNVHYLEVLMSAMDEDTDIVATPILEFSSDSIDYFSDIRDFTFIKFDSIAGVVGLYQHLNNILIGPGGKLFRLNTIGNTRFPLGRIHEDQYFMPRVFYCARNIAHCNQAIYYYRVQPESVMHSPFSVRRFDDLWAIDTCINFFKKKKEYAIVSAAQYRRERVLIKYNLYARNAKVKIPRKYRVSTLRMCRHFLQTMEPDLCQWYLAQLNPRLAIMHAYWVKIKKIMHIPTGGKS